MKKIILFGLSIFTFLPSFSQNMPDGYVKYDLCTDINTSLVPVIRPSIIGQDRAAGDIIWSNDFSVAADWTATGPSTDYTVNGWSIGNTTNGWFFSNTGNMGTTGDFARFVNGDPNLAGDVIQNGPFTLEYSTPINLAGIPSPLLEFSQYGARFFTLQAIEVSTDNGMNWTQVGNNSSITPLTSGGGSTYGQPEIKSYNIGSAIASNPSNVTIRFVWDGLLNGPSLNYIEYGWYIDDVKIIEGSNYDAQIEAGKFNSDGLEYYMVPISQLNGIELNGEVYNNGDSIHTGLHLVGSIDMNGNVFSGTSPNVDLPPNAIDTLVASTLFTPNSGLGIYDITWTFVGNNPDDYSPGNDTIVDSIQVTNSTYARDNGIQTTTVANFAGNSNLPFRIGNVIQTFNNGYINQLEIKISDDSSNTGQLIFGSIYQNINNTFVEVATTADYQILGSDLDSFINLQVLNPLLVQAGDEFLICASHYGGQIDVGFCMAQPTYSGSVLGFDFTGQILSLNNPNAIMVRAHISESITVNQIVSVCSGDAYSIGSSIYSISGVYSDTLIAISSGNDSIVNTTLNILQPFADTVNADICFGEIYNVGNSIYTLPGIYTDTMQTIVFGCDSIITTNLTVGQPLNTAVTVNQFTLTASLTNATNYQWVDCDAGFQPIPGATSQSFSPLANGNFAVSITSNGCSALSLCNQIIGLGIDKVEKSIFSIFPNPTENKLVIMLNENKSNEYYGKIINNLGQTVLNFGRIETDKFEINNLNLQNGIYFIELFSDSKKHVEKLIISK
ncbi:MAG: T9SS type A sorting domain-containing protein [Crocinitomicaceae bacterium]